MNAHSPIHREAGEALSKAAKRRLRPQLFEKQDGRCAYCGTPMTLEQGPRLASFDHVTAREQGGQDVAENLLLACWQCNRAKGCMTPEQLRALADAVELFERGSRPIPVEILGASENGLPEPTPHFPRWLRDMPARHGIIIVLTIWAGTFIAIWRLNP